MPAAQAHQLLPIADAGTDSAAAPTATRPAAGYASSAALAPARKKLRGLKLTGPSRDHIPLMQKSD